MYEQFFLHCFGYCFSLRTVSIIVTRYEDYFINDGLNNLHLRYGCAAIDAGISDGAPVVDRDELIRPVGSGIDIGAYEYRTSNVNHSSKGKAFQSRFAVERRGGMLVALLPLSGGTLNLFDLSGRQFETAFCRGNQHFIVYQNCPVTCRLIAHYTADAQKFTTLVNVVR